jgi:hypothetical protein
MNRRQFAILLPAVSALVGCAADQKSSSTATLLNSDQVREALKATDIAISELESKVGRFKQDNWRQMVPEVQSLAAEVRDTYDNLRRALGVSET